MALGSRYSSSPKIPPSRPIPDCLNPPKGANGSWPIVLIRTRPAASLRATRFALSGSADFFPRDAHVAGDIGKHGGLHEIPALQSLRMTFSADNELRTFLDTRF